MEEEGVAIDQIESLLQEYADDLTRLANALTSADDDQLDSLAEGLQQKKLAMVSAVQGLTFLDKREDQLMEDLKAWEGLAKKAARRSQAADKAVLQAETAIREAIEELRKEDSEVSS
jgi:hypothetical protein